MVKDAYSNWGSSKMSGNWSSMNDSWGWSRSNWEVGSSDSESVNWVSDYKIGHYI